MDLFCAVSTYFTVYCYKFIQQQSLLNSKIFRLSNFVFSLVGYDFFNTSSYISHKIMLWIKLKHVKGTKLFIFKQNCIKSLCILFHVFASIKKKILSKGNAAAELTSKNLLFTIKSYLSKVLSGCQMEICNFLVINVYFTTDGVLEYNVELISGNWFS